MTIALASKRSGSILTLPGDADGRSAARPAIFKHHPMAGAPSGRGIDARRRACDCEVAREEDGEDRAQPCDLEQSRDRVLGLVRDHERVSPSLLLGSTQAAKDDPEDGRVDERDDGEFDHDRPLGLARFDERLAQGHGRREIVLALEHQHADAVDVGAHGQSSHGGSVRGSQCLRGFDRRPGADAKRILPPTEGYDRGSVQAPPHADAFDRQTESASAIGRLRLILALISLALAITLLAGIWATRDLNDSSRERLVDDAIPLQAATGDLVQQMLNQETSVLAFLVTGREASLAPYRSGVREAALDAARIHGRGAKHPVIARLMRRVDPEIASLQRYFAAQIARVRRGPTGARDARRRVNEGKRLFDAFRQTAEAMQQDTARTVRSAQTRQDQRARDLFGLLAGLGGLALAVTLALTWIVPRRGAAWLRDLATERRATERAERNARILAETGAALSSAVTAHEVAEVFTGTVSGRLGANGGGLFLVDDAGTGLVLVSGTGGDEESRHAWEVVPLMVDAPIGAAARDGAAAFLGSRDEIAAAYPALAPLSVQVGDHAWAVLPLMRGTTPIGAMNLNYASEQPFDERDRDLLAGVSERVSEAITRAQLFDGEKAMHARTERLREITADLARAATVEEAARALTRDVAASVGAVSSSVFRRGAKGALRRVAVHDEAGRHFDDAPYAGGPADTAARTGLPVWLESAEDWRERFPQMAQHHRALGLEADASIPLTIGGKVIGVISAGFRGPRRFSPADRAFLTALAGQCAQALERARLDDEQRLIAHTLQASLLPTRLAEHPRIEIAVRYLAAGDAYEVGGDFYDVFDTHTGIGCVIGDVCGKGTGAAALTSLCRHTVRAAVLRDPAAPPTAALALLNDAILAHAGSSEIDDQFATVQYAMLTERNRGTIALRLASGGHPPALIARADGNVEPLASGNGMPLGMFPAWSGREMDATLAPGDSLVLYTDGVIEARRKGDLYGEGQLAELIRTSVHRSADELASHIEQAVHAYQRGPLQDDVAILVARVRS